MNEQVDTSRINTCVDNNNYFILTICKALCMYYLESSAHLLCVDSFISILLIKKLRLK